MIDIVLLLVARVLNNNVALVFMLFLVLLSLVSFMAIEEAENWKQRMWLLLPGALCLLLFAARIILLDRTDAGNWAKAVQINTLSSYSKYCMANPYGWYVARAEHRLSSLSKARLSDHAYFAPSRAR